MFRPLLKQLAILSVAFASALYFSVSNLYINISDSVPVGLYVKAANQTIARGDYVVFFLPDDVADQVRGRPWFDEKTSLLKTVAGLPGDTYTASGDGYYINGELIGRIFAADKQGRPLPQLPAGLHEVEQRHFLPAAAAPNSFDSRYYGQVSVAKIKSKVIPLLTLGAN
jgi:conjugative transfer signal peptidase TraF